MLSVDKSMLTFLTLYLQSKLREKLFIIKTVFCSIQYKNGCLADFSYVYTIN